MHACTQYRNRAMEDLANAIGSAAFAGQSALTEPISMTKSGNRDSMERVLTLRNEVCRLEAALRTLVGDGGLDGTYSLAGGRSLGGQLVMQNDAAERSLRGVLHLLSQVSTFRPQINQSIHPSIIFIPRCRR